MVHNDLGVSLSVCEKSTVGIFDQAFFFNLSTQWAFWPVNAVNSKGLGANIFACQNSELLLTSYFPQFANTVFLYIQQVLIFFTQK